MHAVVTIYKNKKRTPYLLINDTYNNNLHNILWVRRDRIGESDSYIGVTGEKQYILSVIATYVSDGQAYLEYSPSINNVTPDITDY